MKKKNWPTEIEFNLVFSLEMSLQEQTINGKIGNAEAVEIDNMLFRQKEKLVLKVHTNKIRERSDDRHSEGYCYTYVLTSAGSRQKGGSSYRQLIEKLYEFYFGWADKKMALRYNRNLGNEDQLRENREGNREPHVSAWRTPHQRRIEKTENIELSTFSASPEP